MFLKQSLYSDYCAVYATGMALTLAGYPTDKKRAMSLFGAKPGWQGASHEDISRAASTATRSPIDEWRHCQKAPRAVFDWLQSQWTQSEADPVITTAWCRHRKHQITCGHAFVLVGADERGLLALDPLGNKPLGEAIHNVVIPTMRATHGFIATRGTDWDICVDSQVSTLRLAHLGMSRSS